MILRPILGKICSPLVWLNQSPRCYAKPTVKINKEKFQLILDVGKFRKSELCVKAHQEYVVIQGKQERRHSKGYVLRQFSKKYRLPEGCDLTTIEPKLSSDGILTITAARIDYAGTMSDERELKIQDAPIQEKDVKDEEVILETKKEVNPCANYQRVKPKENK